MNMIKSSKIKSAVFIGTLCSLSYLIVYFARNILSAVTPQIIEGGSQTTEYVGSLSSVFFVLYAIGQLINGMIGDKVKARYMISFGLALAGICNFLFPFLLDSFWGAHVTYGITGFFLSMIYAPMTKVIAENTEPIYATRCSLGCTFAAFFGSPFAGAAAAFLVWQSVFYVSAVVLIVMGTLCFTVFLQFEKHGIIKYNQYTQQKEISRGVGSLIEHRIVKFTLISIITGIIRTTVVFWLPTYISQYLGFSADRSAGIFTIATLVIAMSAFIAVLIYEKLRRNMDLTIFIAFVSAMVFFLLAYFSSAPFTNIVVFVLAIFSSNCAATMLWSRYCPSLRDTGMVSTATGFLDFMSYMAAAISSAVFASAASEIGWRNLILIYVALMVLGTILSIPKKR